MIKRNTIIYDMDGTTLNTLDDLTASMNHVMGKYGFPLHSAEEYRRVFGSGIRYALEQSVPRTTPPDTIDEMIPAFKEHYNVHCLDKTRPYDGIIPLMKQLQSLGFKQAIVSNKIDSAVKELNEKFFSEVINVAIGERPEIRRKPAPDTVFEALRELGSLPGEAVYIGDSEVDLATARNAGLPCISVLWGFRDRDCLMETGADIFAASPEDILSLLRH
ncbi:MAG: HAD family hydrolase [Lachnospiraceae bacterium]|nr:HAD family hydrolase [Lachnospiraceae bacterium]